MITKADIVDEVFINSQELAKKDIKAAFDGIVGAIIHQVAKGNSIQIRGFATISPHTRKAKKAHDFKENKQIDIPERKTMRFKVSREVENVLSAVAAYDDGEDI